MTAAPSIEIVSLPNGKVGFRVAGGRIYAALAAAERFAAVLAAKVVRVARKAVAARKGTLAKRVARLIEKAQRLIRVVEARGAAEVERAAKHWGVFSNVYIAAAGRVHHRVGRINHRIRRLERLVVA